VAVSSFVSPGFASFPFPFLFYHLEVYEHVVDEGLRREFSGDVLHGLSHAELSESPLECMIRLKSRS